MGNMDIGMVVNLFFNVVKVSAVASVGILLVFAISPVLEKRHTVFWRYLLFLCLAVRLALPFDISLSQWAAVIPISAGWDTEGRIQEEASGNPQREGIPEETSGNPQREGILREAAGNPQVDGSQEGNSSEVSASGNALQEGKQPDGAENHTLFGLSSAENSSVEHTYKDNSQREEGFLAKESAICCAALCWASGAAIYWVWQIGCYGAFIRRVKKTRRFMGRKERIPIYATKAVSTPMLAGLWKPQILLPDGEYGGKQLEYILRHEFAHYQRKDLWARLLLSAARAVHWFNPLVARMESQAAKDIEFLCDSQAVRGFTKEEKKQYGRTLLAFADSAGSKRSVLCTSGLSRGGEALRERFANLFSGQKKKGALVAACGAAALLAVSLFVAFGTSASEAEERQAAGQAKESAQPEGMGAEEEGIKPSEGANEGEIIKPVDSLNEEEGIKPSESANGGEVIKPSESAKNKKVEAAHAIISLPAQMQQEEPVVPPGSRPEIVADQAEITMENAAEELVNLRNTKEENLTYLKKGSEASQIYRNQDGDRYGFDWAGNLVSYKSSMDLFVYGAAKTTVEECQEAADYYLSFLVEDPSYYTLTSKYYRAQKHCYIFNYRHQVQGMDTNDRIEMWIHDPQRNLAYYEIPRSGVFQEMDGAALDKDKILQKALELFSQWHQHEGELINPTLENISVWHKPKRDSKGEIGYEVYFSVANDDICGCQTVQFVPFDSVAQ